MNVALDSGGWAPDSWQRLPALQQPVYKDRERLARVLGELARLPPIVVSWEIDQLKSELAAAQRGERFLLQGGDCAEGFADCDSDTIARKLKILLQMSVVLLHGLKKPVIRVGRIAGQFAKPRSADTETRDGVTLPSYRGDLVNRSAFTAVDREPDPELLLRGYERAALTLNFVRALVDGGFADMHHPEYWDLGFLQHAKLRDAYRKIIDSISDSLDFYAAISGSAVHEASQARFYASHEGLHLLYEQAQTRYLNRRQRWYNLSTHMPWIGLRTSAPGGAHVEYFRGIANPIAVKVGDGMDAATARRAGRHPEPGRRARPADADPSLRRPAHRLRAASHDPRGARCRPAGAVGFGPDARQYGDDAARREDAALREHPGGSGVGVSHPCRLRFDSRRRAFRVDGRRRDRMHRAAPAASPTRDLRVRITRPSTRGSTTSRHSNSRC